MPKIDSFVDNHVWLLAVISSVIFDDLHSSARILLHLQACSRWAADDDEQKNHDLVGASSDAVENSNQSELVEDWGEDWGVPAIEGELVEDVFGFEVAVGRENVQEKWSPENARKLTWTNRCPPSRACGTSEPSVSVNLRRFLRWICRSFLQGSTIQRFQRPSPQLSHLLLKGTVTLSVNIEKCSICRKIYSFIFNYLFNKNFTEFFSLQTIPQKNPVLNLHVNLHVSRLCSQEDTWHRKPCSLVSCRRCTSWPSELAADPGKSLSSAPSH